MNNYPEGNLVKVRSVFTDSDGNSQKPTAVLLFVRDPDGNTTRYVFGEDAGLTSPSTGTYQFNIDTFNKRGLWLYTWTSTGTGQADSGEKGFYVE